MPIRIRHKVVLTISKDPDGKKLLFKSHTDDALAEQIIDAFEHANSGHMTIEFNGGGTAEEDIPFGDVTAVRGIYILADNNFSYRMNGGVEVFSAPLADDSTGRETTLFKEQALTDFTIINTSTTENLHVTYAVWGDVTP
jgi:hypothetical protein